MSSQKMFVRIWFGFTLVFSLFLAANVSEDFMVRHFMFGGGDIILLGFFLSLNSLALKELLEERENEVKDRLRGKIENLELHTREMVAKSEQMNAQAQAAIQTTAFMNAMNEVQHARLKLPTPKQIEKASKLFNERTNQFVEVTVKRNPDELLLRFSPQPFPELKQGGEIKPRPPRKPKSEVAEQKKVVKALTKSQQRRISASKKDDSQFMEEPDARKSATHASKRSKAATRK